MMNDELKKQIERLKEMGIELDISTDTPESELSAILEQIDDQLAELGQFDDITLDSEEPATLKNMSALAIDVNVESKEVIAALVETNEEEADIDFAEQGLAILFEELNQRSLAFCVEDTESDPMILGAIINQCLSKHGSKLISKEELQSLEEKLGDGGDNIYEDVDDVWYELCHALDERGMGLIQLLSKSEIDSDIDSDIDDESIKLIAIPEPESQKWTNRGFGHYVLLSFSDLFLSE